MARRFSLSRFLYRASRVERDIEVLSSGNPERIARRAKNKLLGRLMARAGLWRRLWR